MARVTPGLWRTSASEHPCGRAATGRWASTWSAESTNFAVYAPSATAVLGVPLRRRRRRDPAPAHRAVARHLARRAPRRGSRAPATATGSTGRGSPSRGLRFNPHKLLLDPYARAVCGEVTADAGDLRLRRRRARSSANTDDSAPYVPRSVVVDPTTSTGGATQPLRHRWRDTVIYELHVKGMTALHDRVPEELRGTYAGLATPAVVDYLQATSASPRSSCCRSTSSSPSRRWSSAGWSTTGATTRSASSPRTTPTPPPATAASRSPSSSRWCKALHEAGHRGDPRRRLQPHRRGRAARPDAVLPRPRRPRLLLPGRPTARRRRAGLRRHLLGRHRLRQHRQRRRTRWRCG